jgi:hypothetical protein
VFLPWAALSSTHSVWELYTLFALCESADESLDACSRVVIQTTDDRLIDKLANFDLADAHCYVSESERENKMSLLL